MMQDRRLLGRKNAEMRLRDSKKDRYKDAELNTWPKMAKMDMTPPPKKKTHTSSVSNCDPDLSDPDHFNPYSRHKSERIVPLMEEIFSILYNHVSLLFPALRWFTEKY